MLKFMSTLAIIGFAVNASASTYVYKTYDVTQIPSKKEVMEDYNYLASFFRNGDTRISLGNALGEAHNSYCNSVAACKTDKGVEFSINMRSAYNPMEEYSASLIPNFEVFAYPYTDGSGTNFIVLEFLGRNKNGLEFRIYYSVGRNGTSYLSVGAQDSVRKYSPPSLREYFVSIKKGGIFLGGQSVVGYNPYYASNFTASLALARKPRGL